MYKIVNLSDLNIDLKFIESDKVIEINSNKTKMQITNNDYAHKSQSYLAKCIDIADSSMTSYLKAIDNIKSTYFTTDITNIYLKNGSAISLNTFNTIMSSDAFLTKDGCKKIETECIAYIDELKNKAVSLIMAHLNTSFIEQNSVAKLAYGQVLKGTSGKEIKYTESITQGDEQPGEYNFESGEFSLPNLLFDTTVLETESDDSDMQFSIVDSDAWKNNFYKNTFLTNNQNYDTFKDIINIIDPSASVLTFNADEEKADFKINVPEDSFDYKRNKTIPVAKLVEYFLKQQIKKCIKTVCNRYVSQMTSIPVVDKA